MGYRKTPVVRTMTKEQRQLTRQREMQKALEQPNRRTVENLFSDLLRGSMLQDHSSSHAEYKKVSAEEDELEEKLLNNPALKKLKVKRHRAWSRWNTEEREFKKRAIELKMEYQAKGLTPDVRKKILKLIEDIKSCR